MDEVETYNRKANGRSPTMGALLSIMRGVKAVPPNAMDDPYGSQPVRSSIFLKGRNIQVLRKPGCDTIKAVPCV